MRKKKQKRLSLIPIGLILSVFLLVTVVLGMALHEKNRQIDSLKAQLKATVSLLGPGWLDKPATKEELQMFGIKD